MRLIPKEIRFNLLSKMHLLAVHAAWILSAKAWNVEHCPRLDTYVPLMYQYKHYLTVHGYFNLVTVYSIAEPG